jgi:hypothetical protein
MSPGWPWAASVAVRTELLKSIARHSCKSTHLCICIQLPLETSRIFCILALLCHTGNSAARHLLLLLLLHQLVLLPAMLLVHDL